ARRQKVRRNEIGIRVLSLNFMTVSRDEGRWSLNQCNNAAGGVQYAIVSGPDSTAKARILTRRDECSVPKTAPAMESSVNYTQPFSLMPAKLIVICLC